MVLRLEQRCGCAHRKLLGESAWNGEDREILFTFWGNATPPTGYQGRDRKQANEPGAWLLFSRKIIPNHQQARILESSTFFKEQTTSSKRLISLCHQWSPEACTPDTLIAFTDGSCHLNPGLFRPGACIYLPHETNPVFLKQPVSKLSKHGSILQWKGKNEDRFISTNMHRRSDKRNSTRLQRHGPQERNWPGHFNSSGWLHHSDCTLLTRPRQPQISRVSHEEEIIARSQLPTRHYCRLFGRVWDR